VSVLADNRLVGVFSGRSDDASGRRRNATPSRPESARLMTREVVTADLDESRTNVCEECSALAAAIIPCSPDGHVIAMV